MRCLLQILCTILLAGSIPLPAQQSSPQEYAQALQLYQQNRLTDAIRVLEPLTRLQIVPTSDAGRVWLLLAAAYRAQADYSAANPAYERAISLLKKSTNTSEEYAIALREAGGLRRELGDLDQSEHLEKAGLRLAEQSGNHAAIARASAGLAELSFDRGDFKSGYRFLTRAESEGQLSSSSSDDDRAYLAQLRGWFTLNKGDWAAAAASYRQAADLLRAHHGDNFALTGWSYVLLGNAYGRQGSTALALDTMRAGIAILEHTVGINDTRYAVAEIQYAKLLRRDGHHPLAASMQEHGMGVLRRTQQARCTGCTINVAALR